MPAFSAVTSRNATLTTFNVPHTVSGSDRYITVSTTVATGLAVVSSVTWKGQQFTRKVQHITAVNQTEVWELVAPATGTDNVVVTFTDGVPAIVIVQSYVDVRQTIPTRTPVLDDVESGSSHSFNVPSDTGELVVGLVDGGAGQTSDFVSGANQATRLVIGSANHVLVDDEPGASPNVSLEYTWTGSGPVSFVAFSLLPPETPPPPPVGEEPGIIRPRFESVSSQTPAGMANVLEWTHNHQGTSGRLLLVPVFSLEAIPHPLNVTYRGQPLLFAGSDGSGGGNSGVVGLYYGAGLGGGAGTVRVVLDKTRRAAGAAVSLSTTNRFNAIATTVSDLGSGTGAGHPIVSLTAQDTQLVIDFAVASIADNTFTVDGVDQVERLQADFAVSSGPSTPESGNILISTRRGQNGATPMSWTASGTTSWWTLGALILPPQPGTVVLGNEVVQDIRPQWWGAKGTGGGDDAAALERVMAVSALRASQPVTLPAGVYNVDQNLTIDASIILAPGAVLRPTSGNTISVTGPVDPSIYKHFDTSLGGAVAFTGSYTIASATIISVPFLSAFVITGTAAIETILLAGEDAIVPGSDITLKFNAAASVLSTVGAGTGTGNIAIAAGDFVAAANDVLTLTYVDGAWRA